jgi:hypothetical protein
MKNWVIKHKASIKKWGLVVAVIYTIKAVIYTSLIVWAAVKFSQ